MCEQQEAAKLEIIHRKPGLDIALVLSLRSLIKKHQIDVIHCHQYSPYFYGLLAGILTRKKVIFTEHGRFYPDIPKLKRKILNPIFSVFTEAVTAISKATVNALMVVENFPKHKISLIYNGVADLSGNSEQCDIQKFKQTYHIAENALVFGTISRLEPIKNQQMMMRL